MNELALGDGWKLYEEKGGKYDGVLTLELHTVYGKVEVRLMGKSWLDMGAGILRVYGNAIYTLRTGRLWLMHVKNEQVGSVNIVASLRVRCV